LKPVNSLVKTWWWRTWRG